MYFEQHGPFRPSAADLSGLNTALRSRGYVASTLAELGVLSVPSRPDLPLHERQYRARGDDDVSVLARLFVLAGAEDSSRIEALLRGASGSAIGVDHMFASGILASEQGDRVRATAALIPIAELLIAREFYPSVTGRSHADVEVLPVGRASVIAGLLPPREPGARVLDIGCGQGVQMVLATQHAQRIVGTDVSPRVLNFAAMNLSMNRAPRAISSDTPGFSRTLPGEAAWEVRLGSVYEPVADLRCGFDLIVSNPPFVITPDRDRTAFAAEFEGDAIVERIVSDAAEYLSEGGWCVTLGSWTHQSAEDWPERPKAWVRGKGVDVLVGNFKTYSPRDYAVHWLDEFGQGKDFTPQTMEHWTSYYQRLNAGTITYGFIALRKRMPSKHAPGASNWADAVDVSLGVNDGPAGECLKRLFASRTLLHGLEPGSQRWIDTILGSRLKLSRTAELVTTSRIIDEQWTCTDAAVRETRGFPTRAGVWPELAQVLSICDGGLSLGQAVQLVARQGGHDRVELTRRVLDAVAPLMLKGLLSP